MQIRLDVGQPTRKILSNLLRQPNLLVVVIQQRFLNPEFSVTVVAVATVGDVSNRSQTCVNPRRKLMAGRIDHTVPVDDLRSVLECDQGLGLTRSDALRRM